MPEPNLRTMRWRRTSPRIVMGLGAAFPRPPESPGATRDIRDYFPIFPLATLLPLLQENQHRAFRFLDNKISRTWMSRRLHEATSRNNFRSAGSFALPFC